MKEAKYEALGNYAVLCEGRIIAKSVLGDDGYEVRILQGMDRDETTDKILKECPEFARENNLSQNKHVYLFSQMSKTKEKSEISTIRVLLKTFN